MFYRHFCLSVLFVLSSLLNVVWSAGKKMLLPPPTWECIQTIGGNVILNWSAVPDPGGNFVQYEVHSQEDGLLAVIPNINTTSYTDIGVSSAKHYFLVVIDNLTGPSNSTTLENLWLTLGNPNNGTAILNWNTTNFTLPAAPARPVDVLREYPAGTWTIQDSVTSTTTFFRDTIDVCQAFLNYQIAFPGNGCDFVSNIVGDIFEDKITPSIPVISNVTIDSLTGAVTINWNVNPQADTYGYVVYLQNQAGNVVELDTVWGLGNTSYTYNENTANGALTYSVAAFDSCYTSSIPATFQTSAKANVHSSVFLEGYYDPCGSVGVLEWSAYFGWANVDHYEIYLKSPTDPWVNIGTTTALQFSHIFTAQGLYELVIMAVHADGRKSCSNKIPLNVSTTGAPSINYILSASVVDQQVYIRHIVDTSGNVSAVAFERLRKDGTFYEIGRENVFLPVNFFTDEGADVEQVNAYRAVIIDSCGLKTTISDTVYTTVLSLQGDSINYINTLTWTPYIGFDGTIQRYDLFRIVDGTWSPTAIGTVGPTTFTFDDNVEQEFVRNELCYYVVAVENTNSYGFAEHANSNVKCSEFTPAVYIPNSFTPGGFNPVFRPQYTYMKLPLFEMRIYNRWGETVYFSEDPLTGWTGNNLNSTELAPDGVYAYSVRFYGIDDKEMVFTGHVNLLR